MTTPELDRPVPTVDEIRTWGATVDVPTACTVFGISNSHGYELVKRGDFPARVIRLGRRTRVITASILDALDDHQGATP
ncbi:MAG TPA: DNA-binding protein [Mycobacteriales bacterium]